MWKMWRSFLTMPMIQAFFAVENGKNVLCKTDRSKEMPISLDTFFQL